MLELNNAKKNKINLSDYNFEQDIANRSLISELSFFEYDVLQEIFFSPLKISLRKLARNLGCTEIDLLPLLHRLVEPNLLTIQDDTITVDKEHRKYFEFHMKRFDAEFKPDMEYLQGILRKVPIHVLPSWYAIPRTSNNIFESIVEKYLFSPHLFQRYMSEIQAANPIAYMVMQEVFSSKEHRISSQDLMKKHRLSRREFEELALFLEFSLVCCVTYTRGQEGWLEWITPFHEWSEYLKFFQKTDTPSIANPSEISVGKKGLFPFVEELSLSLKNIPLSHPPLLEEKLLLLQLIVKEPKGYKITEQGRIFLTLPLEQRAIYLYRHPLNRILHSSPFPELFIDRNVREVEKSLKRVLYKGWVFFDDFLKGAVVSLREDTPLVLKKTGKAWSYTFPSYSEEESCFIKMVIFQWLFEAGMVMIGNVHGRDCFAVTAFGASFFEE